MPKSQLEQEYRKRRNNNNVAPRDADHEGMVTGILVDDDGDDCEVNPRQCTDCFCLLLFLCFVGFMCYVGVYAGEHGDLRKLTRGFDWAGRLCGVSENVTEKNYLYWCTPDNGQLRDGICVEHCPTSNNNTHLCPGNAVKFINQGNTNTNGTLNITVGAWRLLEPKRDYPTTQLLQYCLPTEDEELLNQIVKKTVVGSSLGQAFSAFEGIWDSWRLLVGIAIMCIIFGYLYLFTIRIFVKPLVYTIAGVIFAVLLGGGIFSIYMGCNPHINIFSGYVDDPKLYAWVLAAIIFILWILYSILLCFSASAIKVTIASIELSCKVIWDMPSMLFQPIVQAVLMLAIFAVLMYGFALVVSLGNVSSEEMSFDGFTIPFSREFQFTQQQIWFMLAWIFGVVWILETLQALGQFAISHAVVVHTLLELKTCMPLCHGYMNGLVFHLGTLAFGGLVIGIMVIITSILTYLSKMTKSEDGRKNAVLKMICCCCVCCFKCCTDLIEMANRLAYTDVAIEGCDFPKAIQHVIELALKNPIKYAAVHGSTTVVKCMGIMGITGLSCLVTYFVVSYSEDHQASAIIKAVSDDLVTTDLVGTVITAGLIGFTISYIFMNVFDITSETLMYCILWKQDHGHDHPMPHGWDDADGAETYSEMVRP